MLSIFPSLFAFSLVGTALLRLLLGIVFLYFAYKLARAGKQKAHPGLCTKQSLLFYGGACIEAVMGLFLCIGLFTQIAALLAALLSLDHLLRRKQFEPIFEQTRLVQLVLFCLSLALLTLGPGLFSLDLPL